MAFRFPMRKTPDVAKRIFSPCWHCLVRKLSGFVCTVLTGEVSTVSGGRPSTTTMRRDEEQNNKGPVADLLPLMPDAGAGAHPNVDRAFDRLCSMFVYPIRKLTVSITFAYWGLKRPFPEFCFPIDYQIRYMPKMVRIKCNTTLDVTWARV